MSLIIDTFNLIFFAPIVNLLVLILQALQGVHMPGALGFAIILLTIAIRLLVWPAMASQLKSAKKMADLKPQLDILKGKHKDDKQGLAAAQMALYKEHGVNPAGGCLPALIQIPIIMALYQAIFAFFGGPGELEKINNVLYIPSWRLDQVPDLNFFGINLAAKPSDFGVSLLLLIPLITAVLQLVQSKMMAATPVKEYPTDSAKEKKEKETAEDSMAAIQSQMMYMMPVMVGYFAFQFPVGLALYWNTFTILGIVQQYFISGWGGLSSWLKLFKR